MEITFEYLQGTGRTIGDCAACTHSTECHAHYYYLLSTTSWNSVSVFNVTGTWTRAKYKVTVEEADALALRWWTGYGQGTMTGILGLDSITVVSVPMPIVTAVTTPPAAGGQVNITGEDYVGTCTVTIDGVITSETATVYSSTLLSIVVPVKLIFLYVLISFPGWCG